MPVVSCIGIREMPLMSVCHPLPARLEIVAPGIAFSRQPSTGSKLPLCFCGQSLAGPLRISQRVLECHFNDWIFLLAFEVALRPGGMAPVRSFYVGPPLVKIIKRNGMFRRRKHYGAGDQFSGWSTRKFFRCRFSLCYSYVTRRLDELGELLVGHVGFVHPKPVN